MAKRKKIPKDVRDEVLVDAMHRCCLCPEHHEVVDLHHVVPISEGGPNTEDNLMAVCPTCHAKIHRIRNRYTVDQLRMYKERWVQLCALGLPLDARIAQAFDYTQPPRSAQMPPDTLAPTSPYAARPTVPTEGEPLALIAAALEARRLLLVWADVPFPPEERSSAPAALRIKQWQDAAPGLPGTPFDFAHGRPWPLTGLPPLTILSLDPSDRLKRAFRYAGAPLQVVCARADLPARERHNLLKLGGDLDSRTGLLLDWDDVRKASSDPDKAHLLREARRAAQDGAVLAVAPSPSEAVARIWRELVAPAVQVARHHFALGPAGFAWPEPLTRLAGEVDELLLALADTVIPPPLEPAETEALRHQLSEARQNLRLIEERTSEYVMSTDVPLQLVKEKRHLRERIAELEKRLGLASDGETRRE